MATTPRPPSSKPLDLDITIVSAKHLKNSNWRHGDLKPYSIFWVDPDRRLSTKSDDAGSTRPVWNERFVLPLSLQPYDSTLTLEIFHSKPSETPKPLVGVLRLPLKDLTESDDSNRIQTFELLRPSGRPQGKIRLKLAVRERQVPDYHVTPPPTSYFSSAPSQPPSPHNAYPSSHYATSSMTHFPPVPGQAPSYATASVPPPMPAAIPASPLGMVRPSSYSFGGYSDPFSTYHLPGYYSQPPPMLPPRPFLDRPSGYSSGHSGYGSAQLGYSSGQLGYGSRPSAPVDYTPYDTRSNDSRSKSGKVGMGTGLAIGAVAGALGGIALEEGLKYEEEKFAERGESELAAKESSTRDNYSEYRGEY